jgi:AraC family transcriptional regulator
MDLAVCCYSASFRHSSPKVGGMSFFIRYLHQSRELCTVQVVDLQKKSLTTESHTAIVADIPIRSFSVQGKFYFGDYYEPFLETPEHSHPHCEIVTLRFEEPTPVEMLVDGHSQEIRFRHSTTIFPAHIPHCAKCITENRFSILALDLKQIAATAYEDVEEKAIELQPLVAGFDPVIDHFEQLLRLEMKNAQSSNLIYIDSLMTALSVHLLRQYGMGKTLLRENFSGLSYGQLRPAIEYIQEHLEENLSLEVIAQVVGMSRYHFIRCFKQAIGISPYQYLIQQRIDRAKHLLEKSQSPLSEIASACGFSNQSHFATCFKQQTGATPRYFRQTLQQ